MKVKSMPKLMKWLLKDTKYITIWPFGCYCRDLSIGVDMQGMIEEEIHWRQQRELLGLFFYLWYCLAWFWRFIFCWDRLKAYTNISMEREAKLNCEDPTYLSKRKHYAFFKYIFRNTK